MRIAIFAITKFGASLAETIADSLAGCTTFIKGRDFERLRNAVDDNFHKFDALIFVSATGIAVRMIAPHIVSKLSDPAVLVIDERGQHIISLLSGHVGGANDLTLEVATIINGEPVITTATDVENKIAVDSFAYKLGLKPDPKEAIKAINAAILKGDPVFVTAGETVLNLTPLRLIVGIGCKRGSSKEHIKSAVTEACKRIGQPIERISLIASIDLKSDESGLLEFAASINRDIVFFNVETLQQTINKYSLSESEFVKHSVGVGNVCEAAALSSVGRACHLRSATQHNEDFQQSQPKNVEQGRFALTKTSFDGVTVALIWEKL